MSWTRGIPGLSDPFMTEPHILLCHYFDIVLLVEVLLLSVVVDKFLAHRLIQQLEILQTSLDNAVFPEPILPSADVVQRIPDFVVA